MTTLKTKIKETLLEERQRKLKESFIGLNEIEDPNFLIERYFSITNNLINEGYSFEEIQKHLHEAGDVLSLDNFNLKDAMLGGGGSMLKEYLINILLTYVFGGTNQGLISTMSVVFADYNVLDLLKPFKDESNCTTYMPKLVDALLEALTRYLASSTMGTSRNNYGVNLPGLATSAAGNLFGEVIKESNIGETVSNKFCKIIH
jgi:hypothetical protein